MIVVATTLTNSLSVVNHKKSLRLRLNLPIKTIDSSLQYNDIVMHCCVYGCVCVLGVQSVQGSLLYGWCRLSFLCVAMLLGTCVNTLA